MSIGKRISDAIDKMEACDPEGALFAVCAALEATAVKEYGQKGRASYKSFICQNLGLITAIAFGGRRIENLKLEFDHPDLTKNADGIYSIEEIFYHAVRCGLYHEAKLPSNLQFTNEYQIRCDNGSLVLPTSLLFGLIMAVVVAPSNSNESAVKPRMFNTTQCRIPINKLWGRRSELLWLMDVETEVTRQHIEAEQNASNHPPQQNGPQNNG